MTMHQAAARRVLEAAGTPEGRRQARLAAIGSTVGTTIEWYDFFLYNTGAALVFPTVFFPGSSAYAGQLQAFATYAVGFAARPLGAAIFGHWGDRVGRKATLIVTLVLMGSASTVVGLLPGTASIGGWAPAALVLLRLLQGVAVGGEWSGAVLLAMEWGDQGRRGLTASIPQLGGAFGLILGTGLLYVVSWAVGPSTFLAWGWRLPFLFSSVMLAVGLFLRLRILETPAFARTVEQGRLSRLPSLEAVRRHWRPIVLCAAARMSEQAPFYVVTAFALSYLTDQLGYSTSFALAAVLSAAALAATVIPLSGHLSDRLGRGRVVRTGAVLTGCYGFVLFAAMESGTAWLAFAGVLFALVPIGVQAGPVASMVTESFPAEVRYSGAGIAYQLTSVIAGGPAPLVATWLLATTGSGYAVAAAILGCSAVTVGAVALLGDRSRADIEDDATFERGTRLPAALR